MSLGTHATCTKHCASYVAANTEKCLRIYITLSSSSEKLVKLHFSMKMIVVARQSSHHLFYLFLPSALCFHKTYDVLIGITMNIQITLCWIDIFTVKFPAYEYSIYFLLEFFSYSLFLLNDFSLCRNLTYIFLDFQVFDFLFYFKLNSFLKLYFLFGTSNKNH